MLELETIAPPDIIPLKPEENTLYDFMLGGISLEHDFVIHFECHAFESYINHRGFNGFDEEN